MVHRIVALLVLTLFLQLHSTDESHALSRRASGLSEDPYMRVTVRAAKLVFVGSVVRLLESDCLLSGTAPSLQGMVFKLRRVFKGAVDPRDTITVLYPLMGDERLEVLTDGCNQLSPEVITREREFIVACDEFPDLDPASRWGITGGPWVANEHNERMVAEAIALGEVGVPEKVWLEAEIDVDDFIQGKDLGREDVVRAIRRLEELSGLQRSQRDIDSEEISRAALQEDLDSWRDWFETYGQCLIWQDHPMGVALDKACMEAKRKRSSNGVLPLSPPIGYK